MTLLVVRRIIGALLALWAVLSAVFFMIHFAPGDPAQAALMQSSASTDVLEQRRAALGLDLPIGAQYLRYLLRVSSGDLGVSWSTGQSVAVVLMEQLRPTLALATASIVVAVLVGLCLGISASMGTTPAAVALARGVTGLLLSVPVMVTGIVLIVVFAIGLDWLPATGYGSTQQIVLPAFAIGLGASGGIARSVDAGLTAILHEPFLLAARAKGLTRTRAMARHGLRVGLLPVIDIVALQLGYLLSGTVVTETLFARPGMGRVLLSAILNRDLPLLQGVVVISAVAYTGLNILADVAHGWLDPRIRAGG